MIKSIIVVASLFSCLNKCQAQTVFDDDEPIN